MGNALRPTRTIQSSVSKSIVICSDSMSGFLKTLVAIQVKTVKDCKTLHCDLFAINKVTLIWVLGHFGIDGNERALAHQG